MTIKRILYKSRDYEEMVRLRIEVLLEPISVPSHYIIPEKEEKDFFIAAFQEDNMIGGCVLTPLENHTVQLRQMFVRPEFQGKHTGVGIVRFAETLAVQNGFTRLLLHARDPVIEFYKKCGYEVFGDAFSEVGIGHHKMQKNLV